MPFFKLHTHSLTLSIKVSANAPKNEVKTVLPTDDFLGIRIRAVREKGKANEELIYFLSKFFDVSKANIEILRGHTASLKVVQIATKDPNAILKKLGIDPLS